MDAGFPTVLINKHSIRNEVLVISKKNQFCSVKNILFFRLKNTLALLKMKSVS